MKQFEQRLADARYGSGDSSQAEGMADLADSAARRLADAGQAIRRGLGSEGDDSSDKAQEMAEQLAKDAEAYDESLSEAEKQKMQDRLKAAERLLESMAGAQWTTMSSGGGPGAGHVYTNDPHASPADAARLLARQFWSMALEDEESAEPARGGGAVRRGVLRSGDRVLREGREIRVARCRKMIFADYPGHLVALGLVLASAAIVLVAFRAGPLQTPQRSRYRRLLTVAALRRDSAGARHPVESVRLAEEGDLRQEHRPGGLRYEREHVRRRRGTRRLDWTSR